MAVLLLTWTLGAGMAGTVTRLATARYQLPTFTRNLEMTPLLKLLVKDNSGQDLIQYGLLVGIITAGAVTAISAIGPR